MRGAHVVGAHDGGQRGIIPADAGSTRVEVPDVRAREDHPRGCGEHKAV